MSRHSGRSEPPARPESDEQATVRFGDAGVELVWPGRGLEARYCGDRIDWSLIRDVGSEPGPAIRLRNGATILLAGDDGPRLRSAAERAGVPAVDRRPVWDWLLSMFLDTDYTLHRDAAERGLAGCGITAAEAQAVRSRVAGWMGAYNGLVWEWAVLDQRDLLSAWRLAHPGPVDRVWPEYRRFRSWTDEIADRGRPAPAGPAGR